jgi:hypothetical protein
VLVSVVVTQWRMIAFSVMMMHPMIVLRAVPIILLVTLVQRQQMKMAPVLIAI